MIVLSIEKPLCSHQLRLYLTTPNEAQGVEDGEDSDDFLQQSAHDGCDYRFVRLLQQISQKGGYGSLRRDGTVLTIPVFLQIGQALKRFAS